MYTYIYQIDMRKNSFHSKQHPSLVTEWISECVNRYFLSLQEILNSYNCFITSIFLVSLITCWERSYTHVCIEREAWQAILSHPPVVYYLILNTLQAPKFSSSTEEDSSSKAQSLSSSTYIDNPEPIKMVPLPKLLNPNLLAFDQNLLQLDFAPIEKKPYIDHSPPPLSNFPRLEPELPLGLESQELETRLGDPNFLDVFGQAESSEIIHLPYASPGFGAERRYVNVGSGENEKPVTPDSFIDDFPMDIFDQIEMLPSPSDWWCGCSDNICYLASFASNLTILWYVCGRLICRLCI